MESGAYADSICAVAAKNAVGRVRREQVNLALDADEYEVLQALVFLEGTSAPAVLRPVVSDFLRGQSSRQDVRAALGARRARHARADDRRSREPGSVSVHAEDSA
jgi:hypothetical protein